jgi:hypothetical protein
MKFFAIVVIVVGLVGYGNGSLNDPRCAPDENVTEDAKASVSTLCREAKIENDAANNADFVFTYKTPSGGGVGFSYGAGGYTAAASVSYSNIIIKEEFPFFRLEIFQQ